MLGMVVTLLLTSPASDDVKNCLDMDLFTFVKQLHQTNFWLIKQHRFHVKVFAIVKLIKFNFLCLFAD